jgi:hypothetical protein
VTILSQSIPERDIEPPEFFRPDDGLEDTDMTKEQIEDERDMREMERYWLGRWA